MPAHLIAEEGPLRGLLLEFEEGKEWIIGRDLDAADFVIEDSTVSRKHVKIIKTEDGILLKNMSRVNPAVVNGEEVSDAVLLKEGDRVQIGATTFLFSEEAVPESGVTPLKPRSKKKGGYDDIFGELEEPPPPPRDEAPETPRETDAEKGAYDTIFESSEQEEIPFNLLTPTTLLLKVVSGPNAGAEIGIEKGRSYVLGKDPNSCDIVFQDLSVSRNHARLTVQDDGIIEIEDLGSKNGTLVSGAPILEKRVVTPQDMVALGTTVFLIIDREAPQETIYSPMVPSYEAPKGIPSEEEAQAAAKIAEEIDWKKKPLPMKHLIIAAGSLVAIFIIFLSFFSLFRAEKIDTMKKVPTEQIKEALAKFEDVQFSFNPASGKLFLVGHVLNGVDYQEMLYRIDQISQIRSLENTVVIDELVWKTTNDILSSNAGWRGVSIHSPKPGSFVANGYVQTNDQAALLSEYLTANFPYLDRLQNNVVSENNLTTQLQGIFLSKGFGAVTFQLSGGEVILAGKYSDRHASEFEHLVKEIHKLPGVSGVKNYAVPTHPDAAAIDLSQQYQIGGSSLYDGRGYSVVLNGKIYTLGDSVDGMKITSIQQKAILLEKDGLKYTINYSR
ncbi:MAG: type III secretion system inner membrane ring subunit SctD [Verrucomicrobiota bacterium]|nr:type III secretion system inner membrane ring subunit SctD [Verrucomicrobiota bacterium]